MVKLSLEEIQPPRRRGIPAHPKNRDKDPEAYDAAQDWRLEERRRKEINDKCNSEAYERKVARRAKKAEAAFNSARFVTKQLEEIANQKVVNGNDVVKAAEEQRQEKLDKANDYKKGLKATVTAAELGFSGASLLGAYANWRNWANAASISKRTIANLLQKAQLPMQVNGTLIDAYQTYDSLSKDNAPEGIYNAGSAGLGTAGIVGASDVFLNSRFHSPKVDRILDVLGIIQNAGDFIKFGYDMFNKKDE